MRRYCGSRDHVRLARRSVIVWLRSSCAGELAAVICLDALQARWPRVLPENIQPAETSRANKETVKEALAELLEDIPAFRALKAQSEQDAQHTNVSPPPIPTDGECRYQ